jgi:hypothetical protein
MTLAHIGGVPVEETLLPLASGLLLAGAWVMARVRSVGNPRHDQRQDGESEVPRDLSTGTRAGR